jgi:hypothetical protein
MMSDEEEPEVTEPTEDDIQWAEDHEKEIEENS